VVRVGLLEQPQVIDILNKYFVCVQLVATDHDGTPRDVPGLGLLQKAWDSIPYTRAAFSGEWVLEPQGRYLLSTAWCKHMASRGDELTSGEFVGFGEGFQEALENGLKRHARLRSHEPGSAAYLAEEQKVIAEGQADFELHRPCWFDIDRMTDHVIRTLRNQGDSQEGFEKKWGAIVNWKRERGSWMRQTAAAALGRYAERHRLDFLDLVPFLSSQVAGLLRDEDAAVREAAATALHQLEGQPVPAVQGEELVAAAWDVWNSQERPYEAGAAMSFSADKTEPEVWPAQIVELK
jgi:hypothetical protein